MKFLRNIVLFSVIFMLSTGFSLISCDDTNPDDKPALLALIGFIASHPNRIYVFTGPTHDGNLGGRAGVDNICRNARTSDYSFLNNKTVKGFLSVSATDQIKDLVPAQYQNFPVYGVTTTDSRTRGTQLASSWTQLWGSADLYATLGTATGVGGAWWSGSNENGTYNNANANCSNWTSTTGSTVNGAWTTVDTWVSVYAGIGCTVMEPVMCIAY